MKIATLSVAFLIVLCWIGSLAAKDVRVRGYYRKDGTYVRPHIRSSPDSYKWNNYGPSESSIELMNPRLRDRDKDGIPNYMDNDDDNDGIVDDSDIKQYSPNNFGMPSVTTTKEKTTPTPNKQEPSTSVSIEKIKNKIPRSIDNDNANMKDKINTFLETYCSIYESKDINEFTNLFVPGAKENGQRFVTLIPKYKNNFSSIKTINYKIILKDWSQTDDNDKIKVEGLFYLE